MDAPFGQKATRDIAVARSFRLPDAEVEAKMRACCDAVPVAAAVQDELVAAVRAVPQHGPNGLLSAMCKLQLSEGAASNA